ncbi:MarR family transcriptional regulator [Weissella viridescens]|uniref:MarR family transcriptional regulator n=1 Tax=Weissella viridescens TaxID=1629 RepID=A0A3P2RE21_WEIVI|nr:MarR family transcriptional regulator [Weissella viridescens]RRG17635.1 MarR family transcriptional regulator [Weissella viridescens]
MTLNTDLLDSFGRLSQNRPFALTVKRQGQFLAHRNQEAGRGQLRLLHLLREHPDGLSNTDISEMLDIKPSSVSVMVKHLEHHHYIERIPNPRDKRSSLVKLSSDGHQQFQELAHFSDELSTAIFSGLSDSEKQDLILLLNKLTTFVNDLDWMEIQHIAQHHGWRPGMRQNKR